MMGSTQVTLAPEVLWAQRANEVYITINVSDVSDTQLDLKPTALHFSGSSSGKQYALDMEFFGEIIPEESKKAMLDRNIQLILIKKEKDQPWWPRVLKTSVKQHWLKTDFTKWKDEDDVEDESPMDMGMPGMGGMGMPGMGGMGMPGMEGMGMNGLDFSQFSNFGAGAGFGEGDMVDSDDDLPEDEEQAKEVETKEEAAPEK